MLKPFQQRVVDEKSDLDAKLERLRGFLGGEAFRGLPADEQERLRRQAVLMADYSAVLGERVAAFR